MPTRPPGAAGSVTVPTRPLSSGLLTSECTSARAPVYSQAGATAAGAGAGVGAGAGAGAGTGAAVTSVAFRAIASAAI
eukprot:2211328-Prymnesium_polylepis.1